MSQGSTESKGSPDGLADDAGVELWGWICETYLNREIAARSDGKPPASGVGIDQAQVVFRFGRVPEVRFGEEVVGREVVEGRVELAGLDDAHGLDAVQNVYGFELPTQDSAAGHITAISRSSGLDLIICGAANAQPIEAELDGADEFIDSAESALDGPLGPFANVAFPAAEMLARAELLRLPDPRMSSAKSHGTVRSRYNLWAKFGNTDPRFAVLLNSLGELQEEAKYRRSQFALTSSKAAEYLETLRDMRRHVDRRPRRTVSLPVGEFVKLTTALKGCT